DVRKQCEIVRLSGQEMVPGRVSRLITEEPAIDEPGPASGVQMNTAAVLMRMGEQVVSEPNEHVRFLVEWTALTPSAARDHISAVVRHCRLRRRSAGLPLSSHEVDVIAEVFGEGPSFRVTDLRETTVGHGELGQRGTARVQPLRSELRER